MDIPKLRPIPMTREVVRAFGGLNRAQGAGEWEFSHMENLTSDAYPALAPRKARSIYAAPASPQGLIARDSLCYVDGADFVLGETRIPMGLSVKPEDCPKQLISMGAWVIILPDKRWINTADPSQHGAIEAETAVTGVKVSLCRADGRDYEAYHLGTEAPQSPKGGDLWLDTSATPHQLKQYASETDRWTQVLTTFLRLEAPGISAGFEKLDAVVLRFPQGVLPELNGANLIQDLGEGYIVITGLLPEAVTVAGTVTVSRKMPRMDYVVESGNRLWGCRYGYDEEGEFVNRIYASALGDFRNWNRFQGVSTDSYFANLGTDGPFTGGVNYLGEALFFKENCIHRVWGSYPGEFRVVSIPCRGVEPGSHRSLALVGETLYFKSRSGVCAYDGSQPRLISGKLGSRVYCDAVAGAWNSRLYISMAWEEGRELLVYDTRQDTWHREDDLAVQCFCTHRGSLYAIDEASRNILRLASPGEAAGEPVPWMAVTTPLGLNDPDQKYLSRVTLRLALKPEGELRLDVQYDESGAWEELAVIRSSDFRSFSVPVLPRRCDSLRLRLRGRGDFRLYSMTKTMEGGSSVTW